MTKSNIKKMQASIKKHIAGMHPDHPVTRAMQQRYRELENLKTN